MSSRLPNELERLVVAAGFARLSDWCAAANVSPGSVYTRRARGWRIGDATLEKLVAAARAPIDAELLRAALRVPSRPEARR